METITYDVSEGVGWLTLNRPDVHNAFNRRMLEELREVWRSARADDDVRVIVLTGAGDKAFCTGVDRAEAMSGQTGIGEVGTPFQFDDVGEWLGPKSNDLWKPVIAAVNGMACGGAFYLLGEVEFIIAADSATFFDPHVTFGMVAVYEPMQMLPRMPFGEVMRMSLLGSSERLSAQRAHEIGLVSEVVPAAGLRDAAQWAAQQIAASPALAAQGTVRAIWTARELSRAQALAQGYALVGLGNDPASLEQGQQRFASGARLEWRTR